MLLFIIGLVVSVVGLFVVYKIRQQNNKLRNKLKYELEIKREFKLEHFSEIFKRHIEQNLKSIDLILDKNFEYEIEHRVATRLFHNYFDSLTQSKRYSDPLYFHKTMYKTHLSNTIVRNLFVQRRDTEYLFLFYSSFLLTLLYMEYDEDKMGISHKSSRHKDIDLQFSNYLVLLKSSKGSIDEIFIDEKDKQNAHNKG